MIDLIKLIDMNQHMANFTDSSADYKIYRATTFTIDEMYRDGDKLRLKYNDSKSQVWSQYVDVEVYILLEYAFKNKIPVRMWTAEGQIGNKFTIFAGSNMCFKPHIDKP